MVEPLPTNYPSSLTNPDPVLALNAEFTFAVNHVYTGASKRMKRFLRANASNYLLFAGFMLLMAACQTANQALTMDELKSGEYRSEWSAKGKIKLSDGIYQEKIAPESATELVIKLSDRIAFGDLNGDGAEDAAVILISDPGGSGTFYYLAAVINSNGNPQHAASVFLGDRVKVEEVDISSGKILVKMVIHKRNDPMCCPSLKVEQKYGLQGDALVRQPLEMKASGRR